MTVGEYKIGRLLLKNIVESIANLAGEDALTTIIDMASHKTALELMKLSNVSLEKVSDVREAFEKAFSILRRFLKFNIEKIDIHNDGISISIRGCECIFSVPELKIMDNVRSMLRARKLCILVLMACSIVETLIGQVYTIKDMRCIEGNADIVLTSSIF